MKTTRALFLLLPLALLAGAAWADDAAAPPPSKRQGQGYAWPRTFGGQSDFEFDKAEVLQEKTAEDARLGIAAPKVPTLEDLLDDETVTLIRAPAPKDGAAPSGTAAVSETAAAYEVPGFEVDASTLPSVTEVKNLDLGEFRAGLARTVQNLVNAYQPRAGQFGLDYLMDGLILQAIVTSPEKYAVINGRQYREGDRFQIGVNLGPSDMEFIDALQAQLPPDGSMPASQAEQYRGVYESVISTLAGLRNTNPAVLTKSFPIPATVVQIKTRTVVLDFNGQRHELAIKFTY